MQMTPNERWWLETHFERCWPMLEKAVKKMREPYGKEEVYRRIMDGEAQLFPSWNSVLVTEINKHRDGTKFLYAWLAGGRRDELEALSDMAGEWGRKNGCTKFTHIGRPGFLKKPMAGYRMTGVVMEKDL